MYTKSVLVSALLAASAAATSHETMPAAAVHQAQPSAPAVHQPQPPAPQVHQPQPPVAMAHDAKPPVAAAQPPANQMNGWQDVKGQNQLTVYLVSVGDNNGSLKYFPDTVHAAPGSVVQFQFHPKVSPSANPCIEPAILTLR